MAETFTKFPNWLYDQIDSLTPDEWKIVSIVVRETHGYHRQEAAIDYKRMETIIANRSRLSALIESLAERGFIKRRRAGRSFVYSMGNGPSDVLQGVTRQAGETLPDVTDTCDTTSHVDAEYVTPGNTLLYKKEKKSKEKEKESAHPDPVLALQEYFVSKAAVQPNDRNGTYEREWRKPLQSFLIQADNDLELAKSFMDAALNVAWSGKNGTVYTIARPSSLLAFYQTQAATRKVATNTVEADTIWQQVRAALSNGFNTAPPPLQAAMRAVGWTRIKEARERDVPQLKQEVFNAYRNGAAV